MFPDKDLRTHGGKSNRTFQCFTEEMLSKTEQLRKGVRSSELGRPGNHLLEESKFSMYQGAVIKVKECSNYQREKEPTCERKTNKQ